jgi:Ca2+/H+ antiporter
MFTNKDDLKHLLIYSIIISIISIFIVNKTIIGIILAIFVGIVGGAICTIGFNLYLKLINKYGIKVLWRIPLILICSGIINYILAGYGAFDNLLIIELLMISIPFVFVLCIIYSIEIFFKRKTIIIKQEKCPICKKIRQANENFCSNCGYNYNYNK